MIEGERSFDITLRWPEALRSDDRSILKIPVEVGNNNVRRLLRPGAGPTLLTGGSSGPSSIGHAAGRCRRITGSTATAAMNDLTGTPRRRLRDFVTPAGRRGRPDAKGSVTCSRARRTSIVNRASG